MAALKRKSRNSPPSYSAPTQSSNAKRVKFSIPLREGRSTHKPESSASKVPSHSKGILQNKRPREDDDNADEGLDRKRKFTLCSRPKIKPADGPQRSDNITNEVSGETLSETDEGIEAGAAGRPENVVPAATATSVTCKSEQDGNGEAFAEENPAESKTTLINNDSYEMPSVEADHEDDRMDVETSNDNPVDVDFIGDVSNVEDSFESIPSDEDSDEDSDHDYSINIHFIGSTHRSSSNRHTLTFSNQTLISQIIPSGAHLSRCKLVSCNTTNTTLQSCRVISCSLRSSTAEDCSFVSCNLRDCWIGGCSFVSCNIGGGSAEGCSYRMSNVKF
ncbi:MAG: hypothetical protein Q9198_001804 [Flavoplaca austrocitrina]